MKKYIKIICLILLLAFSTTILFACNNSESNSGNAGSNTIISGNTGNSGNENPDKEPTEDDDIVISGVYIIYNLGDCPDAVMKNLRQTVSNGQSYTLYEPFLPVNSHYGFVGWKNVVTGEMCEPEGVFNGDSSMYLVAVWDYYGPAVK